MNNSYRELKKIARQHHLTSEDVLRALMATVYTNSCERCVDRFHSDSFFDAFAKMIRAMKICRSLASESPSSTRQSA